MKSQVEIKIDELLSLRKSTGQMMINFNPDNKPGKLWHICSGFLDNPNYTEQEMYYSGAGEVMKVPEEQDFGDTFEDALDKVINKLKHKP